MKRSKLNEEPERPYKAPTNAAFNARVARQEARDVVTRKGIVLFWGGWASQWYPSPIEIDGVTYSCAEQVMMAEKARAFGDGPALKKILRSKHPRAMKEVGRAVRRFDAKVWTPLSRKVVYEANLAKFRQNAKLRAKLLATGDRPIAEASPEDDLWGIGLGVDDPRATQPKKWPGKNLLGKAIMRVRETLRREELARKRKAAKRR